MMMMFRLKQILMWVHKRLMILIRWDITSSTEKILTNVIYPNVSDLPGPLLLVVLAVHSAVDHQTTWSKVRQVGYPWKGLSKNILVLQSSCLWIRWGGNEPNLQNLPLAAFYHFGASWKAVVAQSWTKTDRGLVLVAKLAYFMCFTTLLLGWRLKLKWFGLQTSEYENV